MNNFAYFNKPITECSDSELIDFYISFCNGANPDDKQDQKDYKEFKSEVPKRNKEFQRKINFIDSVL